MSCIGRAFEWSGEGALDHPEESPLIDDSAVFVQSCWEGGGNANVAIAGSRLGLNCVTLGHVGDEKFGHFLHRVLDTEGVQRVDIQGGDRSSIGDDDYDGSTLLCWVLVDPQRQHAFCRSATSWPSPYPLPV